MTIFSKAIRNKLKKKLPLPVSLDNSTVIADPVDVEGNIIGIYYSNWSPYKPREHFPHDIDFTRVTHIYYSFFIIDPKTGSLQSSDSWADFNLDLYKKIDPHLGNDLPKGCIGEFTYLKLKSQSNFKTIMSIGGWSNREAWPIVIRDENKLDKFIETSIEMMFEYGFDGIDLDWEFPEDDGYEPNMYLEICRRLRNKMDILENEIFGKTSVSSRPHFHLSIAAPGFRGKLNILPLQNMNQYINYWNVMCYDYYGEWSKLTGYHSNLYDDKNDHHYHKRRWGLSGDKLTANDAIQMILTDRKINSKKVILGMPAYGRGFTDLKVDDDYQGTYINKEYSGVGGASQGEPGIWRYNQLPLPQCKEEFDSLFVSAFTFDPKVKTFVGYDNVKSMEIKARYVRDLELGGGFWWESCGDDHKNPNRSLIKAFTKDIKVSENMISIFKDPATSAYYLTKFPNGFLKPFFHNSVFQEINK